MIQLNSLYLLISFFRSFNRLIAFFNRSRDVLMYCEIILLTSSSFCSAILFFLMQI
jgi:hypothetical protein